MVLSLKIFTWKVHGLKSMEGMRAHERRVIAGVFAIVGEGTRSKLDLAVVVSQHCSTIALGSVAVKGGVCNLASRPTCSIQSTTRLRAVASEARCNNAHSIGSSNVIPSKVYAPALRGCTSTTSSTAIHVNSM